MKFYRNIVFDVGSVLISYRWRDMLKDHGVAPETAERFGKEIFPDPLWKELDLENIPFDEVMDAYTRKYPDLAEEIRWFLTHAEQMYSGRPAVWGQLRELKEAGYGIYLLSNYSSVLFEKHTAGLPFWEYVDGAVISFEVHHVKPDPAIYQSLFSKYGLDPGECLFFDDREMNVEASMACGMDAVTVKTEEDLLEELRKLLSVRVMYSR